MIQNSIQPHDFEKCLEKSGTSARIETGAEVQRKSVQISAWIKTSLQEELKAYH